MSRAHPNLRSRDPETEKKLASLELHPGSSWGTLVQRVELRVGNPIHVRGIADSAIPSGLMIQDSDGAYWVYYRLGDPPLYQQHACFHELAHILFGHCGCTILSGVSPDTIDRIGVGGAMKLRARSLELEIRAGGPSGMGEAELLKAEELAAERGAYRFAELVLPAVVSGAFGLS